MIVTLGRVASAVTACIAERQAGLHLHLLDTERFRLGAALGLARDVFGKRFAAGKHTLVFDFKI